MENIEEKLKRIKDEKEKKIVQMEEEKRKNERDERERKWEEERLSRIREKNKKLESIINDDNPDLDVPRVYKCKKIVYAQYEEDYDEEYEIYRVFTERQIKALYELGLNHNAEGKIEIIEQSDYMDDNLEIELETAKRIVDLIKNGEDPELDEKGKLMEINGMQYTTELTLRQALLCSPNYDSKEIGFKTYRKMEEEKREKEEKSNSMTEAKENDGKGKITINSIKKAIGRMFIKGGR